MTTLTPTRIAELLAMCEAASGGPWKVSRNGDIIGPYTVGNRPGWATIVGADDEAPKDDPRVFFLSGDDDRNFIAAARTALPEALAEIERQAADIAFVVRSQVSVTGPLVVSALFAPPGDPHAVRNLALALISLVFTAACREAGLLSMIAHHKKKGHEL